MFKDWKKIMKSLNKTKKMLGGYYTNTTMTKTKTNKTKSTTKKSRKTQNKSKKNSRSLSAITLPMILNK